MRLRIWGISKAVRSCKSQSSLQETSICCRGCLTTHCRQPAEYFEKLLYTAQAPSLGQLHRVKAYDVLCSYVGALFTIPTLRVGNTLSHEHACHGLLELYLNRRDSLKTKHVKRLLRVIITTCSQPDQPDKHLLQSYVIPRLNRAIFQDEDQLRARPAFDAFTLLLQRDLISATSVGLSEGHVSSDDEAHKAAHELLTRTFPWFMRQDTTHPASNFISAYLDSLESSHRSLCELQVPLWTVPLLDFVARGHVELSTCRNYVLPNLLRRSIEQYWKFLTSLGICQLSESLQNGGNNNTLLLLFVSLQVGIGYGLVIVDGMCRPRPEDATINATD